MTSYIKQHVMPRSEDSVQQRITRFASFIDRYTVAILSRQKLARNKILFFFIKEWRLMKSIAFVLVCIVNFLFLISWERTKDNKIDTELQHLFGWEIGKLYFVGHFIKVF
jgi:hypothetical protein